jgi:sensor c-di-GMP phosphodiesterase-like protein
VHGHDARLGLVGPSLYRLASLRLFNSPPLGSNDPTGRVGGMVTDSGARDYSGPKRDTMPASGPANETGEASMLQDPIVIVGMARTPMGGFQGELKDGQFLFLNVDPHDFDDPSFRNLDPADLGISDPGRIVLEITERTAIKDYPRFQEYLAAFRERGFRFAVDDAGSGYAGLGSIANLAPDYIKLDISLISNIDTNFLKQNLVETLVGFAENHGARVVAEGVERREEFETVKQLGVHLTQGFLFHKPQVAGLRR